LTNGGEKFHALRVGKENILGRQEMRSLDGRFGQMLPGQGNA
jgi:hypothetical protein